MMMIMKYLGFTTWIISSVEQEKESRNSGIIAFPFEHDLQTAFQLSTWGYSFKSSSNNYF